MLCDHLDFWSGTLEGYKLFINWKFLKQFIFGNLVNAWLVLGAWLLSIYYICTSKTYLLRFNLSQLNDEYFG